MPIKPINCQPRLEASLEEEAQDDPPSREKLKGNASEGEKALPKHQNNHKSTSEAFT